MTAAVEPRDERVVPVIPIGTVVTPRGVVQSSGRTQLPGRQRGFDSCRPLHLNRSPDKDSGSSWEVFGVAFLPFDGFRGVKAGRTNKPSAQLGGSELSRLANADNVVPVFQKLAMVNNIWVLRTSDRWKGNCLAHQGPVDRRESETLASRLRRILRLKL